MAKYMTREDVVLHFNTNYSDLMGTLSDEDLKYFWELNLDMLLDTKKISKKQKEIWVFNKKDLEL
jgi:hypothetical protein